MKAIFRFRNPGPTSDNFASMTVVNFKVCQSSKNVDIELKSWICYPHIQWNKFIYNHFGVGSILEIFRKICKPWPTFKDFAWMTEVKF